MKECILTVAALVVTTSAVAQDTQAIQAIEASPVTQAMPARAAAASKLPAGTEVLLETTQEVTTKGKTWAEGDRFKLAVVHDVLLGDYVVIPAGTPAYGRITWLTSKGAFGKSGKMDVELEYIQLDGRRIDIDGTFRQEGEGNTLATVGGVIAAGVFAGFITGRSGRIPQGRELMATLERDVPVNLPAGASITPAGVAVKASAPVEADVPTEVTSSAGGASTEGSPEGEE